MTTEPTSIIRDVTTTAFQYLDSDEVLLFIGARQAGKTTILRQIEARLRERSESVYFLTLEDPDFLAALNASPKRLFELVPIGRNERTTVLIDEVQYLDDPAHFLKYHYDVNRSAVRIIATGSSAFYLDEKFTDSLAGRKRIFRVWTCSFREFLRFLRRDDLSVLDFSRAAAVQRDDLRRAYEEYLTFGGYPRVILASMAEKRMILQDIAYSYVKKDITDARIRYEEQFYKLLKILADQVGNLVNTTELAATLGVSRAATEHHLAVMQRSFHLALVRPFWSNVRKELTKMPKAYFCDLGLRNFFVGRFEGTATRTDLGPLLENAVFRQLLERDAHDEIRFWRTADQHEVDFVVGERAAYEVKAGSRPMRRSRYAAFMSAYPNIPLTFVALDAPTGGVQDARSIIAPWEV